MDACNLRSRRHQDLEFDDVHVRFCESAALKLRHATRPLDLANRLAQADDLKSKWVGSGYVWPVDCRCAWVCRDVS